MGMFDSIVNQVKGNITWKASQGVSDVLSKGANKVFNKESPKSLDKCPKCKTKVTEGEKFCTSCGFKLFLSCAKCNVNFPVGTKFCSQCGGKLK